MDKPTARGYLPIHAIAAYDAAVKGLVFGVDSEPVKSGRVATVQAIGGTGGLKIGADFLKRLSPDATVLISDPSWENHRALFTNAGFTVGTYAYYDAEKPGVNFDGMLTALETAAAGTIVVLHACCHNPTGYDITPEQWDQVIAVVKAKNLTPFLDMAYQGFGYGISEDGAVIASFAERKAEIARQLAAAAAKVGNGARPIEDEALLDEVTALVERPNVVTCSFETEFLGVPQECLILTMKANQKYFPLLDATNKLTNKFLVVSNINPEDTSFVIGGNERVVRPRLADAKFFFDQDRKKTLQSRVEGLGKVVYHNKLGSQGERVERVRAIARVIGQQLGGDVLAKKADQAAQLAKTDLVTDMVGEFPELQGIMGRYYALNDGLSADVADAIEDHYKPRFAGDDLPRNDVGLVVALADKLETLVGIWAIGLAPTGDKDPFALRRHALGVLRMLVEKRMDVSVSSLLAMVAKNFDGIAGFTNPVADVRAFMIDRLRGILRERGFTPNEVEAVLVEDLDRLHDIVERLDAVQAFAALPESASLAAANKRITNILKKTDAAIGDVAESLLQEDAEKALFAAMNRVRPQVDAAFAARDFAGALKTLAQLRDDVDAFFNGVMVMAEDVALRNNRLALLSS
eukprot:gene15542-32836_t